jgi:enamine deaminase RidA (YjgF/YER057c/UK114 family)
MPSIQRLHTSARYSEVSVHNGTVYLAGQVANNTTQDTQAQTAEILTTIDKLLAQAGSSKSHILMATIYLADVADYAGMNAAWDAWVAPQHSPCRATLNAKPAKPEWKVEIVVTAAVTA